MVKVVVVNGRPGCGKTTFEQICRNFCTTNSVHFQEERITQVVITSTVDFVKKIAANCGWDGTKTPENRKFLSDLKALLTNWNDLPCKEIQTQAHRLDKWGCYKNYDWILFVDCREPEEIQKLKERLNATTVLIRRPDVEENETSNRSDAEVFNYDYDLTIFNNSDIINLENEAKKFIEHMRGAPHYEHDD
jgi:dephospho-CoA kinase